MRFLMVDRIVSFEAGRRVEAVKAISLADEHLRGHFPAAPRVPGALLLEVMAQTLGWLVVVTHRFQQSVVLTLAEDVHVAADLGPGHLLQVEGLLEGSSPKGSLGRATVRIEGREVARVGRLLFGHAPNPRPDLLEARFRRLGWIP